MTTCITTHRVNVELWSSIVVDRDQQQYWIKCSGFKIAKLLVYPEHALKPSKLV